MAALNDFLAKLKEDKALAEKFAGLKSIDDVIDLAKGAGFELTAEDIDSLTDATAEELKNTAGGRILIVKNGVVADGVVAR